LPSPPRDAQWCVCVRVCVCVSVQFCVFAGLCGAQTHREASPDSGLRPGGSGPQGPRAAGQGCRDPTCVHAITGAPHSGVTLVGSPCIFCEPRFQRARYSGCVEHMPLAHSFTLFVEVAAPQTFTPPCKTRLKCCQYIAKLTYIRTKTIDRLQRKKTLTR